MALKARYEFSQPQFGNISLSGYGYRILNNDSISVKPTVLPTPRTYVGAVPYNDKIYLFGGKNNNNGACFNTIHEYVPSTDTLNLKNSTLPTNLYGMSYALGQNGNIYLFGGATASTSGTVNSIIEYNPFTDSVVTKSSTLPSVTVYSSACAAPNGKIYIFGGGAAASGAQTYYSSILEYDPVADTLNTKSSTLSAGSTLTSSFFTNDRIYLFGGSASPTGIFEYDFVSDILYQKNIVLPYSVSDATAIGVSSTGRIYIVGGASAKNIFEYNPFTDTIATKNSVAYQSGSYSLTRTVASTANGKVYFFGGDAISCSDSILEFVCPSLNGGLNETLTFDGPEVQGQSQPLLTTSTTGITISRTRSGGSGVNEVQTLSSDNSYKGDSIIVTGSSTKTLVAGSPQNLLQGTIEESFGVSSIVKIKDTSGNNASGLIFGSSLLVPSALGGNCLNLDGVDDYVNLGNTLNVTGSALSSTAWIRRMGTGFIFILSRYRGSSRQFCFWINGSGSPIFTVGTTSATCTSTITDRAWHHVAAVFNGSNVRFFIDGVFINSAACSATITSLVGMSYIGRDLGTLTDKAQMDDIRCYDDIQSDSAISSMYSNYSVNTSPIPNVSLLTSSTLATSATPNASSSNYSNLSTNTPTPIPSVRTDFGSSQRPPTGQVYP